MRVIIGLIYFAPHLGAAAPAPSSLKDCSDISTDLDAARTALWYSNGICLGLALVLAILISLMMCFPSVLVKCVDGIGEMERRRWDQLKQRKQNPDQKVDAQQQRPRLVARKSSHVRNVIQQAEMYKLAHDKAQFAKRRISAERLEKRLAARLKSEMNTKINLPSSKADAIKAKQAHDESSDAAKGRLFRIKSAW